MGSKVKVATAPNLRSSRQPLGSSGARGSSLASLVQQIEKRDPALVESFGISSAAMRAGELVRAMRQSANLSQADLAAKISVSQARVSEIESGAGAQGPTWDVMERVATACGQKIGLLPQDKNAITRLRHRLWSRRVYSKVLMRNLSHGFSNVQDATPTIAEATSSLLGPMSNTYRVGRTTFVVVNLPEANVQVILEARAVAGSQAGIERIASASRWRSRSAGGSPDKEPFSS